VQQPKLGSVDVLLLLLLLVLLHRLLQVSPLE
jgi:hypothetical protein